uniref:8.9 kDa family member n=1 Tax=Rhipicephalus zambeziensis TaxID=60191 RepID=A0A224Y1C3_9ACAR
MPNDMNVLFAHVISVIMVASLLPDLSEEAVGVAHVPMHQELCHYKHYRIEDGKSLAMIKPCIQMTCESLNASYANLFVAGCGVVEMDKDDSMRCKIKKRSRLRPYPGCCPRIVCKRKRRRNDDEKAE